MSGRFRNAMTPVHTWAGLSLGWLLFFMFVTGSAAYFDTEIDLWMQPELPVPQPMTDHVAAFESGANFLQQQAPDAESWFIRLPYGRSYQRFVQANWYDSPKVGSGRALLTMDSGERLPEARVTGGGQTLYQMHYNLHYLPETVAHWLVGIASMFMLIALVTGIIIHRRFFRDFFTFRPRKRQRSWLDAHNVLSVLTLPYQIMITYSGLLIMRVYLPLIVVAWLGLNVEGEPNRDALYEHRSPLRTLADVEPSGEAAALIPVTQVIKRAEAIWGPETVRYLQIYQPGDANARILAADALDDTPVWTSGSLLFDGVTGDLLGQQPANVSVPHAVWYSWYGLHEALFAGPLLRWLFFLSGLLGAAMVATGLILWAVKRRQRLEKQRAAPERGLRLVERLNVATIVGLPVGIAAYFWANRLLPLDWPARADWEVHSLFLVWLAMFVHAFARPTTRAWQEQSWLAAGAFGLLPLLNALTTERHLAASLPAGDWVFAGFDLTVLALGLVFALLARYLTRRANTAHAPASAGDATPAKPLRAGG